MASTYQNDPILPTRLQAPEHAANLAVFEEVDDGHVWEHQSFKHAMAAAVQTMRIDLSNIAQAWMQTDWPEWDQSICCKLKQLE